MNAQMRVSRMSKLNTTGLNSSKFKELKVENGNKNSNDYYNTNISFNIDGKKQIQATKLKDININEQLNKKQNINFSAQKIQSSIYGDDKIDGHWRYDVA